MAKTIYFEDYEQRPQDTLPKEFQAVALASGAVRVSDRKGISGGVRIGPLPDGRFGVYAFEQFSHGRVVPVRVRGGHTAYTSDQLVSRHSFKNFDRAIKKALALAA